MGCISLRYFLKVSHRTAAIENVNSIDERRSKIVGNRVFDCHLSPDFRLPCVARLATNGNQNFCKNRMFN